MQKILLVFLALLSWRTLGGDVSNSVSPQCETYEEDCERPSDPSNPDDPSEDPPAEPGEGEGSEP